jgi:phage shock protein E
MKKIIQFVSIAIFGLLLAACSQQPSSLTFKLSPEEALQKTLTGGHLLTPQGYADLTQNAGGDVTVVDLRTAAEFARGHFPDAVNIPVANLLDKDQLALLRNSKNVVLYGETTSQANGPWLLLTQLGLDLKMLDTSYGDLTAAVATPAPETARYDFAAIFQKAVERHRQELEAGKPKTVAQPAPKKTIVPEQKPKKKVKEEEEGC